MCGRVWIVGVERQASAVYCSSRCRVRAFRQRVSRNGVTERNEAHGPEHRNGHHRRVDIVVNNARLMREHETRVFDGDALFFTAAAPGTRTG